MATTPATATPATCANCNMTGLPILAVRYAVVPADLKPAVPPLPAAMSGKRVKDIALDSAQYKYSLRALRGGVLYLFYEKGPRGKNYWQVFSVTHDGHVSILSPGPEPADSIACANINHSVPRTAYFCIERPEKCGKVWIAFSQALWSGETYAEYIQDATLRAKRMQLIEPAKWINSPQHEHAIEATQANIEQVFEYVPGAEQVAPSPSKLDPISKRDGSHDAYQLALQSSLYPAIMRNAKVDKKGQPITTPESLQTVKLMHQSGKRPDGGSHPPMLLALWDGIGITHELNGYRNEAAGRIKQYGDERELEITALAAIEGAKKALEDKVEAVVNRRYDQADAINKRIYSASDIAYRRANAANLPEPQRGYRLDDLNLMEQWQAQNVPWHTTSRLDRIQAHVYNRNLPWQEPQTRASMEAMRNQQRDPIINEANAYLKARGPNKQKEIAEERTDTWAKYEPKLDLDAYAKFKTNYDKFHADADKLIDTRTVELIKWLEAPLLIDTLEDYHGANIKDGVLFEDVVGDAIFGMGSTKAGAKKIEAWVKEAKASIKTNLIWRAIALNQKEVIEEVDKALQIAQQAPDQLTSKAWDNAGAQVKWNKIADLYKKATSLHNANHKPGVIKQVNTRNVDKLFITVGDAFMKPFAKATDTLNEKMVQSVLLLRAGASEASVLGLVAAQAKYEGVSRARMIQRINTTKTFIAQELTAERKALNQTWSALKNNADKLDTKGAFSVAKEARLGLVVAVLEGVNLWKISQGVTQDPKVQLQLLAAKMALSAAMLDVVASGIKGLASDTALSFQVLKVAGGALSGGASGIGGWMDAKDASKQWEKEKYRIAIFYGFRAGFQFASGVTSILAGLSYADPLLKKLSAHYAKNAALGAALRIGSASTGWLLGARAGIMLFGLGFSIATLAISAAIWHFSDNELQNWCEESAFGIQPKDKRFPSPKAQMESFDKALLDVI